MTLSVVSPGFLAATAVLAVAAWLGWRLARRSRARRTGVVVGALTVALVLTTAGVASAVNTYFGYLPRVTDVVHAAAGETGWPAYDGRARPDARGRVVRLAVPDRGSGFGGSTALVYLPPQYATQPARRFPVVYLVHGSPGVPADWFRGGRADEAGAAAAAAGHPVIVVAPRMSHGWLDDPECVDGVGERVETHFVRDVVPAVDRALRTIPSRDGRILGGMSAGGFCALNLGLRHRALIGTILDLSGDVRPTHAGGTAALFGPRDAAAVRANSPAAYAAGLPAAPATRIWFDCGAGDRQLLAGIRSVAAVLARRGFAVQVHVRPGRHTFRVWRPALHAALPWALANPGAPAATGGTDETGGTGGAATGRADETGGTGGAATGRADETGGTGGAATGGTGGPVGAGR